MGTPEELTLLSEKNRAIFVVLTVLILLGSAFFVQGIKHHAKQKNGEILREGEQLDLLIRNIDYYVFGPYRERVISLIESSGPVGEALFQLDRQRLYRIVLPKDQALRRESDSFRTDRFHLPDGTMFLDMTRPAAGATASGETSPMVAAVHKLQKQMNGFEVTGDGLFYRVVHPLFFQGSYVGAIEIGILAYPPITKLLAKENVTGTFFLRRDILPVDDRAQIAQWHQAGRYVIPPQESGIHFELISHLVPEKHMTEISSGGQTYIVHSHEIFRDFQSALLGGIIALQNITPLVVEQKTFIVESLLFTGALILISMLVLVICFNQLLHKLERSRAGLRGSVLKLHRAKDEWERTFDAIDDIITIMDTDLRIKRANRATCMLLDAEHEELVGKHCHELFGFSGSPCSECNVNEVIQEGKAANCEIVHTRFNKKFLVSISPVFDENGKINAIVHYAKDITEYKLLEAQLRQSQKLEAVGLLTGGIAHDFNNLLSTIMGYADLALAKMKWNTGMQNGTHEHTYEAILHAGGRAAALTRQLLAFSRQQDMEMRCIDINDSIEQLVTMLQRLVGETVNLKLKLASDIGTILADAVQIEQIIMNLVVNAKDAMPDGGRLTLATDMVKVDEKNAGFYPDMALGTYVQLSVADSGIGMTREIQERVFEPFFTTKEPGKGTGLGLATIYGIVKQHGGHILMNSEPGLGSTFKLYFPVVKGVTEKIPHRRPDAMPEGSETVLVVEDEEDIRRLIADTLQPLGYRVMIAATGREAIRLSNSRDEKIDLLLTDIIMPEMNGREVAAIITALSPATRVLFMSGYPDEVLTYENVEQKRTGFISKPIIPSELAVRIREILDTEEEAEA